MVGPYYKTADKFVSQGGAPVLISQADFEACCCAAVCTACNDAFGQDPPLAWTVTFDGTGKCIDGVGIQVDLGPGTTDCVWTGTYDCGGHTYLVEFSVTFGPGGADAQLIAKEDGVTFYIDKLMFSLGTFTDCETNWTSSPDVFPPGMIGTATGTL